MVFEHCGRSVRNWLSLIEASKEINIEYYALIKNLEHSWHNRQQKSAESYNHL